MPQDYYEQIASFLRQAGWTQIKGGKGRHEKWTSADRKRVLVVPRSKSRHTANEVLKQAGLPKAF